MLHIPKEGNGIVKFIGIDPGTKFPGVGVMSYDVVSKKIIRATAQCLDLERMARRSNYTDYQNPRSLQLFAFEDFLTDFFLFERPVKIASEAPFINMLRPGAVIPLAECLYMIEKKVYDYNPYLVLERIPPSNVKNAVKVKGDSGDKHAITEAIKKIPEIMDVLVGDIDTMNNNAVDAVAVTYCSLMRELNHDHSD